MERFKRAGVCLALGVALMIATAAGAQATAGQVLWKVAYQSGSSYTNAGQAIAFSPGGGKVFVAGRTTGKYPDHEDWTVESIRSSDGKVLWSTRLSTGYADDRANAIAVSPDGAIVYVAGTVFDANTSNQDDIETIAYDAATGAVDWSKTYNGGVGISDEGNSIALSPTGTTVYVGGSTVASNFNVGIVIAYSSAGVQQWKTTSMAGLVSAIAVTPDGSTLFMTGHGTQNNADSIATFSLSNLGAAGWSQQYQYQSGYDSEGVAVATSPDGSTVYVGGIGNFGDDVYVTIAYHADTGNPAWTPTASVFGATSHNAVFASLKVAPDGSRVFVTGSYETDPSLRYPQNVETVAYDPATGSQDWAKAFDGSISRNDLGSALMVSSDSATVYVAASVDSGGQLPKYGAIAYATSTGTKEWSKECGGSGFAYAAALSSSGTRFAITGSGGPFSNENYFYTVGMATS